MSHSADAERLTKDFLDGLHTVANPPPPHNNTNTDERVERDTRLMLLPPRLD